MWIITIIFSAFFDSLKPLFGKKWSNNIDLNIIGWAQWFFALFLLVPILLILKLPQPDNYFWPVLCLSAVLNATATILYWKSIALSDLSLVLPIASITPIFLLITSPIITHEIPSFIGAIGIIITVVGAYVVNLSRRIGGFWQPLKHIFSDKGLRFAFIVSIIWSITSNLDKVAIKHSSPMVYITYLHVLLAVFLLPIVIYKKQFKNTIRNAKKLILVGLASGASLALQMYAFLGAIVPYVVSIKRISILFGVIFGNLVFKEKQFKERFLGSLIMLIGIAMILLFG